MGKQWWKSKTVWFNVLALLVALASRYGFAEWQPSASDAALIEAFVAIAVPLINLALRFVTRQAVAWGKRP